MHAYIHTYIHYTYMHACMHAYIHTYIHYTYMHACMHTYIRTYIIHTCMHACIHTYIRTHIIHTHACMHTYVHSYTNRTLRDPFFALQTHNHSDLFREVLSTPRSNSPALTIFSGPSGVTVAPPGTLGLRRPLRGRALRGKGAGTRRGMACRRRMPCLGKGCGEGDVSVCVYMYIYIYMYIGVCIYKYICVCNFLCVYYVYMCARVLFYPDWLMLTFACDHFRTCGLSDAIQTTQ